MSAIQFSNVTTEDDQFICVFIPGRGLQPPVGKSHPNFAAIAGACAASLAGEYIDTDDLIDLFDVGATITRKFERLSERVSVEGDTIYFDGDPMESGLSDQILRFMNEGHEFQPLVNFMEKIESNPNDHSRRQAWDWLNNHQFTLTPEGDVIAYKGVYHDGDDGYRSGHRGNAIRNGESIENDYVPNAVGDVIEMARSEVAHDPGQACHRGLHVGTYDYAQSYAQGAMLRVTVNPRDIVSVPTDAAGAKIRVCRYRVDEIIDAPVTTALYVGFIEWDDFEDDDNCDLGFED